MDVSTIWSNWVSVGSSAVTVFLAIGLFIYARNTKKVERVQLYKDLENYYESLEISKSIDGFLSIHGYSFSGYVAGYSLDGKGGESNFHYNPGHLIDEQKLKENESYRDELWEIFDKIGELYLFMRNFGLLDKYYAAIFNDDFFLLDQRIQNSIEYLKSLKGIENDEGIIEDKFDHLVPKYKKLASLMKNYRKRFFATK